MPISICWLLFPTVSHSKFSSLLYEIDFLEWMFRKILIELPQSLSYFCFFGISGAEQNRKAEAYKNVYRNSCSLNRFMLFPCYYVQKRLLPFSLRLCDCVSVCVSFQISFMNSEILSFTFRSLTVSTSNCVHMCTLWNLT